MIDLSRALHEYLLPCWRLYGTATACMPMPREHPVGPLTSTDQSGLQRVLTSISDKRTVVVFYFPEADDIYHKFLSAQVARAEVVRTDDACPAHFQAMVPRRYLEEGDSSASCGWFRSALPRPKPEKVLFLDLINRSRLNLLH